MRRLRSNCPAAAQAQQPSGGVSIEYVKLEELGIDRTGLELAVAALVR